MTDQHDDPHGGMSCAEVEDWADDMCGEINWVTHYLARRGYVPASPSMDLLDRVVSAMEIAALTGQTRRLVHPVPEEWFA